MNTSATPSVASPISTHRYNGLHWRIAKHWHATPDALNRPDRKVTYWYDSAWRVIQEDHVDQINEAGTLEETVIQQFWGERYIDDAVARLRLAPSSTIFVPAPNGTEEITFQLTDAQFSVIALAAPGSPSVVIDRIAYTPYGESTRRLRSDVDGNGIVDAGDYQDIIKPLALAGTSITSPAYRVEADLDRNGAITMADYDICIADDGRKISGSIGGGVGETDLFSPGVRNSIGYCGYIHNEDTGLYTVRFRTYSPTLGRWLTRDPLGYVDGKNLYAYVRSGPVSFRDPMGTDIWIEGSCGDEPAGHQSICFGDPNGYHECFSFGGSGFSLGLGVEGMVYRDIEGGADINSDYYLTTSPEIDAYYIRKYQEIVNAGEISSYRLITQNCRVFSQEHFKSIKEALVKDGRAKPGKPPVRQTLPTPGTGVYKWTLPGSRSTCSPTTSCSERVGCTSTTRAARKAVNPICTTCRVDPMPKSPAPPAQPQVRPEAPATPPLRPDTSPLSR